MEEMGEDKNRNTEGGKITLYFRGWGMNRGLRKSINENIRICLLLLHERGLSETLLSTSWRCFKPLETMNDFQFTNFCRCSSNKFFL
jgi:hypothetical protein